MKIFFIFFCFLGQGIIAQNLVQCKKRFNAYLNFRASLNTVVKFEKDVVFILDRDGKKEIAVYSSEIRLLADFFEHSSVKKQEKLMAWKGTRKFTKREKDSISISIDDRKSFSKQANQLPLKGFRVAIDPGHFGTNLTDARVEQKYLYFVKDSILAPTDTIKLFESSLTFHTAGILKHLLEEQGALVILTRNQQNFTSFNCTYPDWIKNHKQSTLDSLFRLELLPADKYKKLSNSDDYVLFWEFFRDFDLANRSAKMNAFNPHVSVIIHYNVDEKNDPWKKHSKKNYSMAFIGGAFTADNLNKMESKMDFLRLLLTPQLNQSEYLAKETVLNFNKNLNISIATQKDADYLQNACLSTSSPGVFCRNLALCRKINSPLVYGESLYQDNENETEQLMKQDLDVYGIKANARLVNVARSYFEAVFKFLKNY